MKRSDILKANQFRIILNWVLFYHWEGKEIRKSIERTLEHYTEHVEGGTIEVDISIPEVKNRLQNLVKTYTEDIKKLERDLTRERKTYIQPPAKNAKEFFKENTLPFTSVEEYQSFLFNHVLGEF